MVSKREFIRGLQDKMLFCELIRHGLVGINTMTSVQMYDRYRELIVLGSGKMDAYTCVSEEFGVSEKLVMLRVREMGG